VYTWEGNSANISCEVLAHPGASVVWFRDGQQLPSANTTNIKIYSTPTASYLEVCPYPVTFPFMGAFLIA
jgi:neurocan core protein